MTAIITSLFFLLTMYVGHKKPCEYKRGKLKTFGAWLLILFAFADLALAVCIALKVQDTYNEFDYTFEFFKKYALTSILMLGWAMYIFKSGPMRSKKWKRVVKSILYFLSSFMLLGSSSSDPMAGVMAMVITIVLFFTMLLMTRKNKRKAIENKQQIGNSKDIEEYNALQSKLSFERKVAAKYVAKVLLTLVMACFFIVSYNLMDEYRWSFFLSFFYAPWFIVLFVYYASLIWSKSTVTGEKVLLLPLLQKIHLFKEYSNSITMKRELIKTILPFLTTSTICPFVATLIYWSCNKRNLDIYVLLLIIAPILLIINLTKAYSQKWLYSQEKQKDK
jgi:uncharacterized membrane protein